MEDYAEWSRQQTIADTTPKDKLEKTDSNKKEQRQARAERRKQLQPLLNKVSKLEKSLAQLEIKLTDAENLLGDSALYEEQNKERLRELLNTQATLKKQVASIETDWMEASERLDQAEKAL